MLFQIKFSKLLVSCFLCISLLTATAQKQAQVFTSDQYLDFPCQTLDSLENYSVNPENLEFSKYGGWKAHQVEATGFFYVTEIDNRWWAVDPEGYLYIHKAVNSVDLDHYDADAIYQMFDENGFNGYGCWSDEDILKSSEKDDTPMAYTPKISFIGKYRQYKEKKLDPNIDPRVEMPVFDDEFEAYANDLAEGFEDYVNDPSVFGYLSDNELTWRDDGLPAHLEIEDHTDKNYTTAIAFLTERGKTAENWDEDDQYAYIALMGERYYSIVSAAIKAVDPNHMYIGTRCHSIERYVEDFMTNAGKYLDVFSTNHYNRWGARKLEISHMSDWSGCPLMITEYYAMELQDDNGEGAGWAVKDQESRSWFNDNYVTTLAQTGKLVGFHWFRFQDQDAANKGIISTEGVPYATLLDGMTQVNDELYNFIDYYDNKALPVMELQPEADAYFKGGTNYGNDPELKIKRTSSVTSSAYRASYLRFDVSNLTGEVASAKIMLYGIAEGSENGSYMAHFVEDDTWEETAIIAETKPALSTLIKTWGQADDVILDVTDLVNAAMKGDKKISICLSSDLSNGSVPEYASREHSDSSVWPTLAIYTEHETGLIDDGSSNINFTLYPNPATKMLNIEGPANSEIRIFNCRGQLISSFHLTSNKESIMLDDWNVGVYVLQVIDGDNVSSHSFVKK